MPPFHSNIVTFACLICFELVSSNEGRENHRTVFPRIIDEGSLEGKVTLSIDDDLVLFLQESSPLQDTLSIATYAQGTKVVQEINVTDLEWKTYVDLLNDAVVLLNQKDVLLIKGVVGPGVTIMYDHLLHHGKRNESSVIPHHLVYGDRYVRNKSGEVVVNLVERSSEFGPTRGTIEAAVVVSKDYDSSFEKIKGQEYKNLVDTLRLIFTAVNLMLSKTEQNVLDLQVVVTQVIILTEDSEIYKETISLEDEEETFIKASAPDDLIDFVEKNSEIFGTEDVVLYIGNHQYAASNGNSAYTTMKGVAFLGGACNRFRGALVYGNSDFYDAADSAAHELMHLVGSVHDGEEAPEFLPSSPGAKSCIDDAVHLMTRPMLSYPPPRPLSVCTRDQVVAYIKSDLGSCLRSSEARKLPPISEANIRKIPVNGSDVCKRLHQHSSNVRYISHFNDHHNIKRCIIVCESTDAKGRAEHSIHLAPEYTVCGVSRDQKIQVCIDQMCRDLPLTPKAIIEKVMNSAPESHKVII